ncbi:MAG: hypothetical protein PSV40_18665 [Polaromonas sp.]|uniref:hypothetical protein n=1 Tax=Polaromonas sp. TaxID=1869339 RepID=UPI002488EF1E|nr:hypothetical protein [Polaromonas sp.]MDI1271113.1 hypothetical protein [Polaromonas sp.]
MSFFSWFSGTSSKDQHVSGKARPDSDSSGLTRDERTRPVAGARARASAPTPLKTGEHAGEQKSQRHAKRELLYVAVREAMIRAGVLSASYKFKVLSLDPRGEQFMVMMDLAQEFGGQADRLAEIEVMIAQSAKSRYNIRVTAVYWRMNELVSVGRPRPSSHGAQPHNAPAVAATAGAAAALPEPAVAVVTAVETAVAVVAAVAAAEPAVAAPVASRFEPIQDDEVAAFKQALAAASASGGTAQVVQKGVSTRSGPHSYTLLTGFEDTEMPEMPVSAPALSATQYGDLV